MYIVVSFRTFKYYLISYDNKSKEKQLNKTHEFYLNYNHTDVCYAWRILGPLITFSCLNMNGRLYQARFCFVCFYTQKSIILIIFKDQKTHFLTLWLSKTRCVHLQHICWKLYLSYHGYFSWWLLDKYY